MSRTFEFGDETQPVAETKDRILDAAERLFAGQGYAATSLRQITSEAQVNLAAVNYHFQSKDSLILAVLMRKMKPLERRRLELLDALEEAAGDGPLVLEDVLRALLVPVFERKAAGGGLSPFPQLMGRMYSEPGDWVLQIFKRAIAGVAARFLPALGRALPGMSRTEIAWGMHFSIGSMAHFLAAGVLLTHLSDGEADMSDGEAVVNRMVVFMSGGLRAMAESRKEAAR